MRVLIKSDVWHLDVDSDYPPGAEARKGTAVRRLKINASWVKFSPYFYLIQVIITCYKQVKAENRINCKKLFLFNYK